MQPSSSPVRIADRAAKRWSSKLMQTAVLLLTLGLVLPSFATTVSGTGAGSLPGTALDFTAIHTNFSIQGVLPIDSSTNLPIQSEAMFAIDITDFNNFSAQTIGVPFGIGDTELFLFDALGLGVYGNDDSGAVGDTLSCLPSAGVSNPCPVGNNGFGPTHNGLYYLAVAFAADSPLDGSSAPIFQIGSTTILEPTGAGVIASWDGGVYTQPDFDNNQYLINVTGITGVPEPTSLLLVSPGLFLGWLRRKQLFSKQS